ncbi:MAG TPA: dephospho-CoA kinase [Acidimicrobiales bacterium]|nr:dephospho-CoA kinase [Acidimicrobiales bacterium]
MVVIGCTGGIGSGKSTVAALLERRGARIVDTDALARGVTAPGTPGHRAVVARFGAQIIAPDGSLDRQALAALVFSDPAARRDLEAIVHPLVFAAMSRELAAIPPGEVVVCVLPLLAETDARHRYGLDGVLVVDAPEDLVVERLVRDRGMDETDARSRIAAQADRFQRVALADYVILNAGTLAELEEMTERAWHWIERLGKAEAAPR